MMKNYSFFKLLNLSSYLYIKIIHQFYDVISLLTKKYQININIEN